VAISHGIYREMGKTARTAAVEIKRREHQVMDESANVAMS